MTDLESALRRLKLANSYSRLGAVIDLYSLLPSAEFWRILGQEWNSCDNIGAYRSILRIIFEARATAGFPILEAMDDDDRRAYDALPTRVAIFRGCYPRNRSGLSWTTDREAAARFPFLTRYRDPHGQALLLSAFVRKSDIAFVQVDRGEAEVVVLPRHRRIAGCEHIPPLNSCR